MKDTTTPKTGQQQDLNFLHFKLIAKVTLYTGLSAAAILLVLLFAISAKGEGSYIAIIQAHTITRLQLGSSMLIAALLVLISVVVSVWLISLYSSFRVAGPLYRLSQNLHAAMSFGRQNQIRHDDALHDVARDLRGSVEKLEQHYQQLQSEVDEILSNIDQNDVDAVNTGLSRLREIEARLQLDD